MRTPVPIRLICVLATVAAVLYPAMAAPARTISVPRLLTASMTVELPHGRIVLDRPLTHVAFSWTGSDGGRIRYRTIGEDGRSSRWRSAPETHDLAANDRHFTGVVAVYGAVGIRWRRSVPRGGWMGAVTVDVIDSLSGPRREVRIPSVAHGLASEPRIVTRAEWGADESLKRASGGCRRTFFPVQQLFVHHTAGSNRDRHPRATMRSIYWFHTARRGWCDLAYNFVIARDGSVFEGRWAREYLPWETHDAENLSGLLVRGSHTLSHNPGAVGVSLMGSFGSSRPTRPARRSLVRVLAWEADRHGLKPRRGHTYVNGETGARRWLPFIAGHRDARSTSCPGRVLYRMLPGIRRSVARRIGPGKVDTALTLSKSVPTVDFGEAATVTAALTAGGAPLAGAPVRLYQRSYGGTWKLLTEATTDAAGRISAEVAPAVRIRLSAAYVGDTTRWGAQSRTMRLPVAPMVTLTAEGGTVDGDGVTHFPPTTTTVLLGGTVAPAHPGRVLSLVIETLDDLGEVISTKTVPASLSPDGTAYSYALGTQADKTYRVRSSLAAHDDHAGGKSSDLYLTIDPLP